MTNTFWQRMQDTRDVTGPVLFLVLIGVLLASSGQDHASLGRRLAGAGFWTAYAVYGAVRAMRTRRSRRALIAPLSSLVAFTALAAGSGHKDPAWLKWPAVALLLFVVASFVVAGFLWRTERDERERAVTNGAMSFAFAVTLIALLAFYLSNHFLNGPSVTTAWMLLIASSSWIGAWVVLQVRM